MLIFACLVVFRALLQVAVRRVAPIIPFLVTRNSRDVLEYIALRDIGYLHKYEAGNSFIYSLVYWLSSRVPNVDTLDLTRIVIYLTDIVSAWFWYMTLRLLPDSNLDKNKHAEGYGFQTKLPWLIAGLHLLNPISVIYNEAANPDGVGYFWVSFAVLAAVLLNALKRPSLLAYVLYQVAATGLLVNNSFKMYAVLPVLTMLAVHVRFRFSHKRSVTYSDLCQMCRYIVPHMVVTLLLALCYYSLSGLGELKRHLVDQYTGRGTGIDYSLYWYIHRVVPGVFIAGNIFKLHMMLFCLPMPLMVVLRHRPLEAVIIATVINIVQSPSLSLLGLWYIVSLLALHYPLMDKAFGFTKMATVMFGAMIFSVVAYVVWVGRYIANPNYFFAPQLAILATLCMVLEDYTCATTQLANSAMAHEKKH